MQGQDTRHIAIIGAGLAGLACAWHLLVQGCQVTLFDKGGVGAGASGAAVGLLHPYMGPKASPPPYALEGMHAAQELLAIAENAIGRVLSFRGILRPAVTTAQKDAFFKASKEHLSTQWWDTATCQQSIANLSPLPGLFIPEGLTVDMQGYLEGLWKACQAHGASLVHETIENLQALSSFDATIIAAGHDASRLTLLPLTPIKGQALVVQWPQDLPKLPFSLISSKYISPSFTPGLALIAGTYERAFTQESPDLGKAKELLEQVATFYPRAATMEIVEVRAGIRASTPNHLPCIDQVAPNVWVFTGLGSKGLIYHALFAKRLVTNLLLN